MPLQRLIGAGSSCAIAQLLVFILRRHEFPGRPAFSSTRKGHSFLTYFTAKVRLENDPFRSRAPQRITRHRQQFFSTSDQKSSSICAPCFLQLRERYLCIYLAGKVAYFDLATGPVNFLLTSSTFVARTQP
jgi:hypothetical protein